MFNIGRFAIGKFPGQDRHGRAALFLDLFHLSLAGKCLFIDELGKLFPVFQVGIEPNLELGTHET